MSLAVRARALALRRVASAPVVAGRRFASTHEHDAHHDDHHGHGPVDTNVYPEDSFRAPIWRNFVLVSVLGVAVAKFLPDDWRENNFILRAWRHHGYVEPEVYRERNIKHLEQSVVQAHDKLILEHAERPKKRQWAYQGYTDSGCPHGVPVGTSVSFNTSR